MFLFPQIGNLILINSEQLKSRWIQERYQDDRLWWKNCLENCRRKWRSICRSSGRNCCWILCWLGMSMKGKEMGICWKWCWKDWGKCRRSVCGRNWRNDWWKKDWQSLLMKGKEGVKRRLVSELDQSKEILSGKWNRPKLSDMMEQRSGRQRWLCGGKCLWERYLASFIVGELKND